MSDALNLFTIGQNIILGISKIKQSYHYHAIHTMSIFFLYILTKNYRIVSKYAYYHRKINKWPKIQFILS